MVCRMAQVRGIDLWTVRAKAPALNAVIDYLMPYLRDHPRWRREQIAAYQSDNSYLLAFTGVGLKNPEHVAVFPDPGASHRRVALPGAT